jgi:hypothetical protein
MKIRCFIALLAIAGLCVSSHAQIPTAVNISNVSCQVMAQRGGAQGIGATMTNGQIVVQGELRYANHRTYWAVTAGTTTNTPANLTGDSTTDAIVWRVISSGARMGLCLVNGSTNTVFLSVGTPAVASKGIALIGLGAKWEPNPVPQSAIYAINGSDSALLYGDEW